MDADVVRAMMWVVQFLLGGLCSVLWLNFRDLKARAEATDAALAAYKIHIAENYVTQNELGKAIDHLGKSIDAVFAKLDRIDSKLDNKQDKVTS